MKSEVINSYFNDFNKFVYEVDGLEFWFARDLQNLLGYLKWENFLNIIEKAKIACSNSDVKVDDHFAYTARAVDMPNGGVKVAEDMFLTRYACYLIAQNGDSNKEQVAFAMSYFAIQTRKQELLEKRIAGLERLQIREKLSYSEKMLSGMIYEKGIDSQGFAMIKSKGDKALFGGYNTSDMKKRLEIPNSRPLADFLPTITIKAKDFANEITIFNLKKDGASKSLAGASLDHEQNNRDIRKLLLQKGIVPENLPAEEDVKKLQRKLKSDDKLIVETAKKLKIKQ
ncbi:DNA damage-inducible protein D [Candidatus Falkowbacteria bacterium CG1_02_37_21]|nr:MAG: DNA damage-inducible protein D [Candidatus Falkowbacteria bacterium CG1_02_37_21]